MFTEIDKVLYPNKCEVIQTTSHDFIYPIFKNGSSSLYQTASEKNWKILFNNQIKICDDITIFLRNPLERFEKGVYTYIEHCISQGLDKNTVLYFIKNYYFLNRHYMPQIFWLINLAKYANKDVILSIKDISDIKNYSNFKKNISSNHNQNINIEFSDKLKFYFEADNYVIKFVNQKISMQELLIQYKRDCNSSYNYIFNYAENLINALPKI